jgi:hypothetical protein
VALNIAESLFPGEGDDSFADIINGKVEGLATDKIRAWLTRMAVNPTTSPRGAVFFNGQYQPLDEVTEAISAVARRELTRKSFFHSDGPIVSCKITWARSTI